MKLAVRTGVLIAISSSLFRHELFRADCRVNRMSTETEIMSIIQPLHFKQSSHGLLLSSGNMLKVDGAKLKFASFNLISSPVCLFLKG